MTEKFIGTLNEEQAKFIAGLRKENKAYTEIAVAFKEKYSVTITTIIDHEYGKYLLDEASKVLNVELNDTEW